MDAETELFKVPSFQTIRSQLLLNNSHFTFPEATRQAAELRAAWFRREVDVWNWMQILEQQGTSCNFTIEQFRRRMPEPGSEKNMFRLFQDYQGMINHEAEKNLCRLTLHLGEGEISREAMLHSRVMMYQFYAKMIEKIGESVGCPESVFKNPENYDLELIKHNPEDEIKTIGMSIWFINPKFTDAEAREEAKMIVICYYGSRQCALFPLVKDILDLSGSPKSCFAVHDPFQHVTTLRASMENSPSRQNFTFKHYSSPQTPTPSRRSYHAVKKVGSRRSDLNLGQLDGPYPEPQARKNLSKSEKTLRRPVQARPPINSISSRNSRLFEELLLSVPQSQRNPSKSFPSNIPGHVDKTMDLSKTSSSDLPPHIDETVQMEENQQMATEEFKSILMNYFLQMMFVSGETAEPSTDTTGVIEEIVREQVKEMLIQATKLANRRGVRSIAVADLIFLIRHDKAKVSRLRSFLSWKDVRKNVKDSDDKGGGDAGDAVDFEDGANLPGAGPSDSKKTGNKKAKLILPWEVHSYFSEQVPEREDEDDNEEEEEQNEATLARLASADERTRNMTKDEYVFWSDCRQASFTFRKGKRFREWAGFGVITDSKPNDDIVDILGFLTYEIVQTLTEEALRVKAAEDLASARAAGVVTTGSSSSAESKKRKRAAGEGGGLFEMPEEGRSPVEPKHVREAYRKLQIPSNKYMFMRQGQAGLRMPLKLI